MEQNAVADLVREWIAEVLISRPEVTRLALRQRAKFEGWLKFELAAMAEQRGASEITLEAPLPNGKTRCDLGFVLNGTKHVVELKTPNTNYRSGGVEAKHRPVTKNISSIIEDGEKMIAAGGGIVAFTLFPVPVGDGGWKEYLHRIGHELGAELAEDCHCSRVRVSLDTGHAAEIIVSAFWIGQSTVV